MLSNYYRLKDKVEVEKMLNYSLKTLTCLWKNVSEVYSKIWMNIPNWEF